MFTLDRLWLWIVLYFICIIIWIIFKSGIEPSGFIKYTLYIISVIGSLVFSIFITVIPIEENNDNFFLGIPGLFLLALFFTFVSNKTDDVFSKDTLIYYLRTILTIALIVIGFYSMKYVNSKEFYISILSMIISGLSFLFAILLIVHKDD